MKNDDSEALLQEIAQVLAEDTDYPLEGTFLYAQVGHCSVSPSIYKDVGDHALYRQELWSPIADILLRLWEAQKTDDRWSEIEYVIRDSRFHVTYTYPDEIDEEDYDRRERIVGRHFGNRPIVYPPWDDEDDIDSFEL